MRLLPVAEGADRRAFTGGMGSTRSEMRTARESVLLFVVFAVFPAAHSCPFDGWRSGEKLLTARAAGGFAPEDGAAARVFHNGFHDRAFRSEASR